MHKIYASAREQYNGSIDGKALYKKTMTVRGDVLQSRETIYIEEPDDAFAPLCELLKPGDIFITLGAGNNWPLAEKLYKHFNSKEVSS